MGGDGKRRSALALVGTGAVLLLMAGGLLSAPGLAPGLMTMATMDRLMGVSGYEDEGHCEFWMMDMNNPSQQIERSFPCGFSWDWSEVEDGVALVHEALYDHEKGGVFEAPDLERGQMQEWYRVNEQMLTPDALEFLGPVQGEAGVLMPPPGARDALVMGWVESGGERGAEERVVVARDLVEVGEVTLYGIDWVEWSSSVDRVRTTWHGYDVYISEQVFMRSDPRTAWILEMQRHVVIEMTPVQMVGAMDLGVDELPLDLGGAGEPQQVMELHYATLEEKRSEHAAQTASFQRVMAPIENGPLWGTLLGLVALGALAGGIALVRQARGNGAQ